MKAILSDKNLTTSFPVVIYKASDYISNQYGSLSYIGSKTTG